MQGFSTASSAPETSVQIADLTPGTDYEFRVFAVNSFGQSPASDSCAWSWLTLQQCGRASTASLLCCPHTAEHMRSASFRSWIHGDKAMDFVQRSELVWYSGGGDRRSTAAGATATSARWTRVWRCPEAQLAGGRTPLLPYLQCTQS
jgi:Fibronectin type III domain